MDIKKITGVGLLVTLIITFINSWFIEPASMVLADQVYSLVGLTYLIFGALGAYLLLKNE